MIERFARRSIIDAVVLATGLRVPARVDRPLAAAARLVVGAYRLVLSPWLGRRCLFVPSCSAHAQELLRSQGWNRGMPLVRARLDRCNGNYVLRTDAEGRLELESPDGVVTPEAGLSDFVLESFGQWPVGGADPVRTRSG